MVYTTTPFIANYGGDAAPTGALQKLSKVTKGRSTVLSSEKCFIVISPQTVLCFVFSYSSGFFMSATPWLSLLSRQVGWLPQGLSQCWMWSLSLFTRESLSFLVPQMMCRNTLPVFRNTRKAANGIHTPDVPPAPATSLSTKRINQKTLVSGISVPPFIDNNRNSEDFS